MISIIPSILTDNPDELRTLLEKCEGVVERVQIDILDGVFAGNKTIDPSILGDIDTSLRLDFHLMTKNPIDWVERCIRGMADRIIGQVEMMESQLDFLGKVQEAGLRVGFALDRNTPVSVLDRSILTDLDSVLLMSVPAGFGGQEFHPEIIEKIKELDHIRARDDTPFTIIDDGGITLNSVDEIHLAGVDEVAIGKKLFTGDLKENVEMFRKAAHKT